LLANNYTLDLGSAGIEYIFALRTDTLSYFNKTLYDERTFTITAKAVEFNIVDVDGLQVLKTFELKPVSKEKAIEFFMRDGASNLESAN
jgi:hypothetical protein